MSKISYRNAHSQNMVSCLLLGLFWTWNWIVYQSPTDLSIGLGEWKFPSRSLLLASFAVAGFLFFSVNRRGKKSASRRTRYATGVALGVVILLADILDGSFDGELEGSLFAAQSVAMGVASAFLYTEIGRLFAQTELGSSSRPQRRPSRPSPCAFPFKSSCITPEEAPGKDSSYLPCRLRARNRHDAAP